MKTSSRHQRLARGGFLSHSRGLETLGSASGPPLAACAPATCRSSRPGHLPTRTAGHIEFTRVRDYSRSDAPRASPVTSSSLAPAITPGRTLRVRDYSRSDARRSTLARRSDAPTAEQLFAAGPEGRRGRGQAAISGARACTATMAADPVFLDTNILFAASVAEHPSHAAVLALLEKLTAERTPLCISPQVCDRSRRAGLRRRAHPRCGP